MKKEDFIVKRLGDNNIVSPLFNKNTSANTTYKFISNGDRVLYNATLNEFKKSIETGEEPISFEKAGPHNNLYFEPAKTKVGIVTCGGLCPGLNDVIRSIVNQLYYRYGVERIIGFRYGYEGLVPEYNHETVDLTPQVVDGINLTGGTFLGASRGLQDVEQIVDTLERTNTNILFCIGGDGTLKGAHAINEEVEKRNLKISIAGIPKTIDNDINLIEKSFGFETAFTIANEIIQYAHNEAEGAYNGISLIKLMGRDSGFISAYAALAIQEVNFVLVPEIDFDLEGENGFLQALHKRLKKKHHAVVVVAEGAGQKFFDGEKNIKDASGNILKKDIGLFLKEKISKYFKDKDFPFSLKYIDPSYIIRSAPANANDSKFCSLLAQNAVHAAMAGCTDFVIGNWNDQFTLLPIPVAVSKRKKINADSELWWNILEATGQPANMINDKE
jgi:6-phosphofructokinase 1